MTTGGRRSTTTATFQRPLILILGSRAEIRDAPHARLSRSLGDYSGFSPINRNHTKPAPYTAHAAA